MAMRCDRQNAGVSRDVGAHTVVTDMDDTPAALGPCAVCGAPIVPTRKLRRPRKTRLYCSDHCRYLAWRKRRIKPAGKPRKPHPSDRLYRPGIRLSVEDAAILAAMCAHTSLGPAELIRRMLRAAAIGRCYSRLE
jgi:hypothetical protein